MYRDAPKWPLDTALHAWMQVVTNLKLQFVPSACYMYAVTVSKLIAQFKGWRCQMINLNSVDNSKLQSHW